MTQRKLIGQIRQMMILKLIVIVIHHWYKIIINLLKNKIFDLRKNNKVKEIHKQNLCNGKTQNATNEQTQEKGKSCYKTTFNKILLNIQANTKD